MISQNSLISVLVCNYNYGDYIEEALDSALTQTYPNIEVIIVDDGSSDNSVDVIKKYIKSHTNAKIVLNAKKRNEGICFARNDAIDAAKGDYFIFLDSDDTIPNDYISRMYRTLLDQKADVVYGDVKAFGGEEYITDYPLFSLGELLRRNYINVTSLVRRAAAGVQKFDVELNRKTHEDYDFWLGLSLKGLSFVKSDNTYLNYRIQKSSRNANSLNMKERAQEIVEIWKYSFFKYQVLFPTKLTQDMIFDFYDYQLSKVGDELMALNDVVQKELVPELKRRDAHIQYLANKPIMEIIKEKIKNILKKT